MTDPITPPRPTTALTGEEFKTLAMTNVVQLQNWLTSIPAHIESGAAGLTAGHLDLIDAHLNRCRMFLRSWSLTKIEVPPQSVQAQPRAQPDGAQMNGAQPSPRKGGWPKGRKRNPRVPAEEGAQ